MSFDFNTLFYSDYYNIRWAQAGLSRTITWSPVSDRLESSYSGRPVLPVVQPLTPYIPILETAFQLWDDALDTISFVQTDEGNDADVALGIVDIDGPGGVDAYWGATWGSARLIRHASIEFDPYGITQGDLLTTTLHEIGNILGLGDIQPTASLQSIQEDPFPKTFTASALWQDDRDMVRQLYSETAPVAGIVITGIAGLDTLTGSAGNDTIIGQSTADLINAKEGNDVLRGGPGNDSVNGGPGNDTLSMQGENPGFDRFNGGPGYDILDLSMVSLGANFGVRSFQNIEEIRAQDGGSTWTWSDDAILFIGGDGGDDVHAGGGNDVLRGDRGADTLSGGAGIDTLFGGDGNDVLRGGDGDDFLIGGKGDDHFFIGTPNPGSDYFDGGEGYDILDASQMQPGITFSVDGFTDIEEIRTTHGGDNWSWRDNKIRFVGGDGHDTAVGGDDNDDFFAGKGKDSIVAGGGQDTIRGGQGHDTLRGEGGNDTFYGDAGADVIDGGAQIDTVIYSGSKSGVTVYLSGHVSHGGSAQGDRVTNVENAVGSGHGDVLTGTNAQNKLTGGNGEDTLYGGIGNDTLWGGAGADSLRGNDGKDIVYGDAGNDRINGDGGYDTLFGGTGSDRVLGGNDSDTLDGQAGNDSLFGQSGADRVYGGDGNDLIAGNLGADLLWGNDGDDTLHGNESGDFMSGGDGNDVLFGGSGRDNLGGGTGNDTLDGGSGSDTLRGASGADVFVFSKPGGVDVIREFEDGVDLLDFTSGGLDFSTLTMSTYGGGAGTRLAGGGHVVLLEGTDISLIDPSDFA